ncbi:hypothetical protein HDV63DRAFT_410473 [Trichoderma sp. SZMC 28014]
MPKPKRPESIAISRKDKHQLLRYLEYADPNHIQLPLWGVNWEATHGETRSASKITFHVGGRFVQGEFQTCILVQSTEGEYPVDNTIRSWGSSQPDMGEVLVFYQQQFGVQPLKPLNKKKQPRRDDDDDNEEGGSSSRGWKKKVERGYGERGYGERGYGEGGYGERGYGERGYGERRYGEREYLEKEYGGRVESDHREREYTQISKMTYHTDPMTGKMYYIDKYGKSQWA